MNEYLNEACDAMQNGEYAIACAALELAILTASSEARRAACVRAYRECMNARGLRHLERVVA